MRKKLQQYPLFIALIPLFYILHASNENYGLIQVSVPVEYFLYYFIFSCCLVLINLFIFRKKSNAYFYTILLLIVFFFFGAIHDNMKKWPMPVFLSTYKVLLSLLICGALVFGFYIKKPGKNFSRVILYTNSLFILFILIDVFSIIFKFSTNNQYKADLGDPLKKLANQYTPCDTCQKPDIYFVVFDAYSSSSCLKTEFLFDNSELDTVLLKNNFFISSKSKSNYSITPLSISSTFNLNYLRPSLHNETLTGKLLLQSQVTVLNSELPMILKKEGYNIKNYSVFDLKDHPVTNSTYFEGPGFGGIQHKTISDHTMAGRIKKDIWWNWTSLTTSDSVRYNNAIDFEKEWGQRYIFNNMNDLLHESKIDTGKPKFVYTHVEIPHEPYIFNEKGELNEFPIWDHENEQFYYLNQLKYSNKLLIKIINTLIADQTRPRIIVIEGDHGFRNYSSASKKDKIFCNLNAYYFPDHDYSNLYDSISPVNTFRVILNKYFRQNLPLLSDRSVYIRDTTVKFEKKLAIKK